METKKVVIYTSPVCKYCVTAKKFFDDNGIAYQSIDILEDPAEREKMIAISGQLGLPVITIDNQVFVGFNESKLMEALDIKPNIMVE